MQFEANEHKFNQQAFECPIYNKHQGHGNAGGSLCFEGLIFLRERLTNLINAYVE